MAKELVILQQNGAKLVVSKDGNTWYCRAVNARGKKEWEVSAPTKSGLETAIQARGVQFV